MRGWDSWPNILPETGSIWKLTIQVVTRNKLLQRSLFLAWQGQECLWSVFFSHVSNTQGISFCASCLLRRSWLKNPKKLFSPFKQQLKRHWALWVCEVEQPKSPSPLLHWRIRGPVMTSIRKRSREGSSCYHWAPQLVLPACDLIIFVLSVCLLFSPFPGPWVAGFIFVSSLVFTEPRSGPVGLAYNVYLHPAVFPSTVLVSAWPPAALPASPLGFCAVSFPHSCKVIFIKGQWDVVAPAQSPPVPSNLFPKTRKTHLACPTLHCQTMGQCERWQLSEPSKIWKELGEEENWSQYVI